MAPSRNPSPRSEGAEMPKEECCLYFIDADAGSSLSKIGISKSPQSRPGSIKTSSPYELKLLISVPFESRAQAEWRERVLHFALNDYRMHGEWFSVKAETAVEVHNAISEIIEGQDFDPDDFSGLCQMIAFQCVSHLE